MGKWAKGILCFVFFCICLALIIVGQKTVGVKQIIMQIVGLAGMLALLYGYNKKYQ